MHKIFLILLTFFLLFTCCGNLSQSRSTEKELIIAAGTNLQFALKEISDIFTSEYPYSITFVWGSTGSLVNQIEHGAPYDIFFAADEFFMKRIQKKGLLLDDRADPFVEGRIAIGVNHRAEAYITSLNDLLKPEIKRIVTASPLHAPYGIAAKDALVKAGLWEKVQSKLVFAENIRQCLQFIKTGNADAGIISENIPIIDEVAIIPIDSSLYTPPLQMTAILNSSSKVLLAREFVTFLKRHDCIEILRKYKYTTIQN